MKTSKKSKAIELLREVIRYSEGEGKYNFSHLSDYERSNESFDAWQKLSDEIKNFLNSGK